jgi:hypothetical protein
LPSRRSVVCIIATNVAPRKLFWQTNRRHISAWSRSGSITVWLRRNGAQTHAWNPGRSRDPCTIQLINTHQSRSHQKTDSHAR